jgi:hypothetical protein
LARPWVISDSKQRRWKKDFIVRVETIEIWWRLAVSCDVGKLVSKDAKHHRGKSKDTERCTLTRRKSGTVWHTRTVPGTRYDTVP